MMHYNYTMYYVTMHAKMKLDFPRQEDEDDVKFSLSDNYLHVSLRRRFSFQLGQCSYAPLFMMAFIFSHMGTRVKWHEINIPVMGILPLILVFLVIDVTIKRKHYGSTHYHRNHSHVYGYRLRYGISGFLKLQMAN
jgi:hypothetical protein